MTASSGDSAGWESGDGEVTATGEPTPGTGRGCAEGCAGKGSGVRRRPKGTKSSDGGELDSSAHTTPPLISGCQDGQSDGTGRAEAVTSSVKAGSE